VAGTTGESPTLTHDEKLQLTRVVKDAVAGRAKVLVGTGSNATRASVELTREVTELGVDGIMLVCPYYNKPSQEGLFQHFATVARATHLPVMVYNIESRTARNIEPETIHRLADEVPNFRALKEASAKITQFAAMRLATPSDFHLYSGNDSDTPAVLCAGGCGVVSVAGHVAGDEIREMILAFLAGQFQRGVELYLRLEPLVDALFPASAPNPVVVKEALNLLGHGVGGVRLPLVGIDARAREALVAALQRLGKL
ncbi:MAG: 4-hydroxy-tetrahydrodipicolinate synthase, partial [Armatimonadetes bacterium]|nr:4-hydroxy-tetrahydrodipicolinate synthase [Armatimonadota bacterium]